MRKTQKKQAELFLTTLNQAHNKLKALIEAKSYAYARILLEECQQGAIQLGSLVEQSEGESSPVVALLEKYCEAVFWAYEQLADGQEPVQGPPNAGKIYKMLNKLYLQIASSLKNDIPIRYEIAFFPYKASMWDSLESIWAAADADENCDAYVVPIPYYDREPDGSFGAFHYEGSAFPANVPVTHYHAYHFEERNPDAIYIHNPYDGANYVTSIDPRFYACELKKHTGCLVYVPYYATSGGMNESRASCPVYYDADYIVIQAEKYRRLFDRALPPEKLLPLGSPKFDRAIQMCNNPPQAPQSWQRKIKGKKTFFYNTSINGMLANTSQFLKKMEYIFQSFQGRTDACLIWRPHPLLEATFRSMRKKYLPAFQKLKKDFKNSDTGIYDTTADITQTIAQCDAYIGDAASSVMSLFGMAGKPLFLLNNNIHALPQADDWRGDIIRPFFTDGPDEWVVTQGNKLYHSPARDYKYEFYCDLSEYAYGNYYLRAFAIENGNKICVCPMNAQELLIVADKKIAQRIPLAHETEHIGAFSGAWKLGGHIFLLPQRYPAIVHYDTRSGNVYYITTGKDLFARNTGGVWKVGGSCIWKNRLLLASPDDQRVLMITLPPASANHSYKNTTATSYEIKQLTTNAKNTCGCLLMAPDGDDIWLLPYTGTTVTRWNPQNGDVREYGPAPEGFSCTNRQNGYPCKERPFGMPAFYKNYVVLPPYWGNMFLLLDKDTGAMEEWVPPFPTVDGACGGYFHSLYAGAFLRRTDTLGPWTYRFFYYAARQMYDINLETRAYTQVPIEFDKAQLAEHEPGFDAISDRLQYGCMENAFNSLSDFLNGAIHGAAHDRQKQLAAFGQAAANSDGTSGLKIHQYIRRVLQAGEITNEKQREGQL